MKRLILAVFLVGCGASQKEAVAKKQGLNIQTCSCEDVCAQVAECANSGLICECARPPDEP